MISAVLLWSAATIAITILLPKLRGSELGSGTSLSRWLHTGVAMAQGAAGVGFLYFYFWHRRAWRRPFGAALLGLMLAGAMAACLTAAQLLPVIEFIQLTTRAAADSPHSGYHFSVEPYRLAELIWPNAQGTQYNENSYWPDVIRIPGVYPRLWVPSLYLGGLTIFLAFAGLAVRQGPPWRVWLSVIAIVSLVVCSANTPARSGWRGAAVAMSHSPALERLAAGLGPVDALADSPLRHDGLPKDGDGSVYWWLEVLLPRFRQFRFPGKLFTFTSLALTALAGIGWDRIGAGRARRAPVAMGFLIVVSLCVLAGVALKRQPILAAFNLFESTSASGPLDAAKAFQAILRSQIHCILVLGAGLLMIVLAAKRPGIAGAAALIVMTLDLAAANSQYVMTVEQSMFDADPRVAEIIEKSEANRNPPAAGPFRVHRMSSWYPVVWNRTSSPDRETEFIAWERDTIAPKYGINFGLEYTQTTGVAELNDYQWYFSGHQRTAAGPVIARWLDTEVGAQVIYLPRRAYDMWNTRYFVVPAFANGWRDELRASAAFRFECELIYPGNGRFAGPRGKEASKIWMDTQDFEILRNEQEFPRSWVVHTARAIKGADGPSRQPRPEEKREILYSGDVFWNDSSLTLFDPREVAWVGSTDLAEIIPKLSGQLPRASESVRVQYPNPQEAILDVTLESPGLVILSDVFYPGWQLKIDGAAAPIYRVNVSMRGALVAAGPHRLVYSFAPWSFRSGLVASIAGIVAWLLFGLCCVFKPIQPLLAPHAETAKF